MILQGRGFNNKDSSIPRESGDDPYAPFNIRLRTPYSPRERG